MECVNYSAMTKQTNFLSILLVMAVLANSLVWFYARDMQSKWIGVPPVPKMTGGLGDAQTSYRQHGLVLQNMGDMGGRFTPFKLYDYDALGKWLFYLDKLDGQSDFVAYLAAYYFSNTPDTEKLRPIINFLRMAGTRNPESGEKWRWLAQAIFLAKYKLKDLTLAGDLADELAKIANSRDDMPVWTYNMKAYILNDMGEKQAAFVMLTSVLANNSDKLDTAEITSTVAYICEQILDEEQAKQNELCTK